MKITRHNVYWVDCRCRYQGRNVFAPNW